MSVKLNVEDLLACCACKAWARQLGSQSFVEYSVLIREARRVWWQGVRVSVTRDAGLPPLLSLLADSLRRCSA